MGAVGSDDGREVVTALDALRRQGVLAVSPTDGRYVLKASDGGT
ncbi:MAG: hypothetical protein ACJ8FP_01605 [Xanthobacteraceae bacterium]